MVLILSNCQGVKLKELERATHNGFVGKGPLRPHFVSERAIAMKLAVVTAHHSRFSRGMNFREDFESHDGYSTVR